MINVLQIENQKKRRILRLVFLFLSIAWMGLIFSFSSATGEKSSMESGRIVSLVQKVFFKEWGDLSQADLEYQMAGLTFLIRKLAHFSEYLILGALVSVFFSTLKIPTFGVYLFPILTGFLYASTDEFHQTFVGGRSGKFFDVLVDSAGVVTGVLFILGILSVIYLYHHKKSGR